MLVALLVAAVLAARVAAAFQFIVTNETVLQCGTVEFEWKGGTPPYQITAIGVYDVPVNMTVPDWAVTPGRFSWTEFPFNFSSQVVFVMSDAEGFATGGVSPLYRVGPQVAQTPDCKRTDGVVDWTFAVNPMAPEEITALPQCKEVEFTWQGSYKPPVNIIGVIPGGLVIWPGPNSGTTMSYPVNAELWSSIVYLSWDAAGVTGGTTLVMQVTEGNGRCLDSDTASSLPPVVLGATPTGTRRTMVTPKTSGYADSTTSVRTGRSSSTAQAGGTGSSSSRLSPGAIAGIAVGGVVGLLILLALLIWFCCRRQIGAGLEKRRQKRAGTKPSVDLYDTPPGGGAASPGFVGPRTALMAQNRHSPRTYPDDLAISPFMGGTPSGRASISSMGRRGSAPEWAGEQAHAHPAAPRMGYDSPRLSVTSGTSSVPFSALPAGAAPPGSFSSSSAGLVSSPGLAPSGGALPSPGLPGHATSSPPTPSATPLKLQLAYGDSIVDSGKSSPLPRTNGVRRTQHEDAGPLLPPGAAYEDPQDLPPTYNPYWEGKR